MRKSGEPKVRLLPCMISEMFVRALLLTQYYPTTGSKTSVENASSSDARVT